MQTKQKQKSVGTPFGRFFLVLVSCGFLAQCTAKPPPRPQTTSASAIQKPAEPPHKALERFNTFLDRV